MIKHASALLLSVTLVSITACDSSHMRDTDSGPRVRIDATVGGVDARGPDAGCPGGVCACPSDINPWDPGSPGSQCTVEGARCGSAGGVCDGALSCTCTSGVWQCRVAEPDPACYCGREPTMGSPCNTEGMGCGACCPGPGEWPALSCVEGRWAAAACPPVVCPDRGCPVDRVAAVGAYCPATNTTCGNPCCSSPIRCSDTHRWVSLPEADCICPFNEEFTCGAGSCVADQVCTSDCGPMDGVIFSCQPSRSGCVGCACFTEPGVICEEIDGHIFVRPNGFCG